MDSCYVVMRFCPERDGMLSSDLEALADTLYLAEKIIANYFAESFGEEGRRLTCESSPDWDVRSYWMTSNYRKDAATFFRVYEEEIKDDSASI